MGRQVNMQFVLRYDELFSGDRPHKYWILFCTDTDDHLRRLNCIWSPSELRILYYSNILDCPSVLTFMEWNENAVCVLHINSVFTSSIILCAPQWSVSVRYCSEEESCMIWYIAKLPMVHISPYLMNFWENRFSYTNWELCKITKRLCSSYKT